MTSNERSGFDVWSDDWTRMHTMQRRKKKVFPRPLVQSLIDPHQNLSLFGYTYIPDVPQLRWSNTFFSGHQFLTGERACFTNFYPPATIPLSCVFPLFSIEVSFGFIGFSAMSTELWPSLSLFSLREEGEEIEDEEEWICQGREKTCMTTIDAKTFQPISFVEND